MKSDAVGYYMVRCEDDNLPMTLCAVARIYGSAGNDLFRKVSLGNKREER